MANIDELLAMLPLAHSGGHITYATPYGFSIIKWPQADFYVCRLDVDLDFVSSFDGYAFDPNVICTILRKLREHPSMFRTKPAPILHLERLTGAVAMHHSAIFGAWFISTPLFWLYNNTFSIGVAWNYPVDVNHFDVKITNETTVQQNMSLEDVESLLYVVMNE